MHSDAELREARRFFDVAAREVDDDDDDDMIVDDDDDDDDLDDDNDDDDDDDNAVDSTLVTDASGTPDNCGLALYRQLHSPPSAVAAKTTTLDGAVRSRRVGALRLNANSRLVLSSP